MVIVRVLSGSTGCVPSLVTSHGAVATLVASPASLPRHWIWATPRMTSR
jgi:hypothetical protein